MNESRVRGRYKVPRTGALYVVFCSEGVLYEEYYVLLITCFFGRQLSGTFFCFSLLTVFLPPWELSSQSEAYKHHLFRWLVV